MRLIRLLASAAISAAVMIPIIPAAAYAASASTPAAAQAQSTSIVHHTAVSIVDHTIVTGPAALRGRVPAALINCNPCTVSPRVSCGGFNGHIQWGNSGITVWGIVWDTCGNAWSSLWLSFNSLGAHTNEDISEVENGSTGVDHLETAYLPGNIGVAVCNTHGGWHCGGTWHV